MRRDGGIGPNAPSTRGRRDRTCARTRRGKNDTGIIRIDFPGYSGGTSLEPISWDSWFQKFDDANLAMILQEETAGGERSNFNKIIARESVKDGKVDTAKSRRARNGHARRGGASTARGAAPRRGDAARTTTARGPGGRTTRSATGPKATATHGTRTKRGAGSTRGSARSSSRASGRAANTRG